MGHTPTRIDLFPTEATRATSSQELTAHSPHPTGVGLLAARRGETFGTLPASKRTLHEPSVSRSLPNVGEDNDDDDDDNAPRVFMMPTELQYVQRVVAASPPLMEGRAERSPALPKWDLEGRPQTSDRQIHNVAEAGHQPQVRAPSAAADRQYAAMRMEEYLVELLVEGRQDEYAQVRHSLDQEWLTMTSGASTTVREVSVGNASTQHSFNARWPHAEGDVVQERFDSGGPPLSSEVYWDLVDRL
jgi:hypothetical protein